MKVRNIFWIIYELFCLVGMPAFIVWFMCHSGLKFIHLLGVFALGFPYTIHLGIWNNEWKEKLNNYLSGA